MNNKTSIDYLYFKIFKTVLMLICFLLTSMACSSKSDDEKFNAKMASAKNFFNEEKYQEARIELQTAIDLKPLDGEAYYQLAEVLIRLGDFGKALESYNSAINYDPNHKLARIHLASLQLIAKQYEYAESNIQEVLDRDPENEEALVLKANLTFLGPRKNIIMSKEILKKVLDRNPNFVAALASLAHLEIAEENFSEAEDLLIKAKKVDPKNQAIQVSLTDLYARQGRLEDTEKSLNQLVEANPENTGFKYVLGDFFLRKGLNDNAVEQFIEVLKKEPAIHDARDRLYEIYVSRSQNDKAKALTDDLERALPKNELLPYFKGRNELLDGNLVTALEHFRAAIINAPNFAPAFRNAGIIELMTGQLKDGVQHLEQAINIDPNNVQARYALARVKFAEADIETAKLHVAKILEQFPKHLSANILRADIALLENDHLRADKVYTFLRENFPDSPIGFYKSGLLAEKQEQLEKAINFYRKTIGFETDIINTGKRLALCLSRVKTPINEIIAEFKKLKDSSEKFKGEYDLILGSIIASDPNNPDRFEISKKYFRSAIDNNPNLIAAYFAMGGIDSATGNIENAVENYKKLLEKDPGNLPSRMLLALAYEQQGNYSDALLHYNKILEMSPRFGPAANNAAYLMAEEIKDADLNEALRLAQIAKEELPKEASVADTLGWIHFRKNNHRAALTMLQEAYDLLKENESESPINPELLYHLASVHNALGDKESARSSIKEAIKNAGENHPKIKQIKSLSNKLN